MAIDCVLLLSKRFQLNLKLCYWYQIEVKPKLETLTNVD